MREEDRIICLLLKKQNPKGMELLFKEYYRPLVLWADTFFDDIHVSEDLVQEFFIKLWEKNFSEKLTPHTLKSYLFTSIKNQSLNLLEKHDPLRKAASLTCINPAAPEYDDLDEQLLHYLEEKIDKLAPRSRDVLTCVYLKGMRYQEVADLYGISIATVKTLLVNALKKLREDSSDIVNILFIFFYKKYNKQFNRF